MDDIDPSVSVDQWARVDDFIGADGGPMALDVEDILKQLEGDGEEE